MCAPCENERETKKKGKKGGVENGEREARPDASARLPFLPSPRARAPLSPPPPTKKKKKVPDCLRHRVIETRLQTWEVCVLPLHQWRSCVEEETNLFSFQTIGLKPGFEGQGARVHFSRNEFPGNYKCLHWREGHAVSSPRARRRREPPLDHPMRTRWPRHRLTRPGRLRLQRGRPGPSAVRTGTPSRIRWNAPKRAGSEDGPSERCRSTMPRLATIPETGTKRF